MTCRPAHAAALALLVAVACGSSGPVGIETPASPPASAPAIAPSGTSMSPPTPPTRIPAVALRLARVASLESPLAMAVRPGDAALYVAEQTGKVVAVRRGRVDTVPVLDVSDQIVSGGEQGLLGLTFSPDGRFLYVDYTDLQGNTNVVEFAMGADGRADVGSRREILFVRQPFSNHNGGNVLFGPDGDLYVGLGDGGGGGDPMGNGQSLSTLLGKILRIEPRAADGSVPPNGRYGVPADNPFLGRAGARPEIWAYGLRNPWRFTFDRDTGDLWIGDVGQGEWEEVDLQTAEARGGANYGWNRTEGLHPYSGGAPPANWAPPVFDFSHASGACAVTGGYVYRGSAIPALRGVYLYADFCRGELLGVREAGGRVVARRDFGLRVDQPASFGQDADGELYVLSLAGTLYRLAPG